MHQSRPARVLAYVRANHELYLFLVPGLVFMTLFCVMPMTQITIAFKQFKPALGLANSRWVGLAHFQKMLSDPELFRVVRNTLVINLYQIIFILPPSMVLAILINEVDLLLVRKAVQTIIYVPHFFTWVVVYSVFYIVFGSGGVVNTVITALGGERILFFMRGGWFRFILVLSDAWHSVGWGTIVYLAAISGIDPQLYDAALADGANKFRQIWHITVPCLMPTFVLMVSIRLGHIMTAGFGQVLAFYNPTVYEAGDIISTYVYRTGLGQANFSYAAAVGLFNSVIGFVLVMLSNVLSRRVTGRSVW